MDNHKKKYSYKKSVKSKAALERVNIEVEMMDAVSNDPSLSLSVQAILQESKRQQAFHFRMGQAPWYITLEEAKANHLPMPYSLCVKIEQGIERSLLEKVIADPSLHVTMFYQSPAGRNYYQRQWDLTAGNLKYCKKLIQQREKTRAAKKHQRSLITEKIRYDVLKRDHFRCVLCGRSAEDGIKLHVDHIKPISKGGTSAMQNLRTLCEECNRGKGAKYDPYGQN